jgi:hypothetical protein
MAHDQNKPDAKGRHTIHSRATSHIQQLPHSILSGELLMLGGHADIVRDRTGSLLP